jgi:DHA3 family macrolide efflux protein-like MFS transporter
MSEHKYIVLFKDKNFLFFWIGIIGFGLGGVIFSINLNWWVYVETNSEAQLGIVGTLTILPMLILCFFSGVIIDVHNRQTIMIISLLIRGIVIFLFPIFAYLKILNLWIVYLLAFFQGISVPFFINAVNAIMPEIILQENLFAANALIDSAMWFSLIIGSSFTGFLIDLIGSLPLFIISTYIFIGTGLIFFFITYTAKKRLNKVSVMNFLVDLKKGIKVIKKDNVIFILIITWMGILVLFANGPTTIGWPVFSERIYNSGAEGYGLLISLASFSSLIGSLVLGHWGSRLRKGILTLIGYLWGAIGILFFSFTTDLMIGLIVVFIWNFYYPLINIPFWTILQERVPEEELGKVSGASLTISYALGPISTIMTGYIFEFISIPLPFILFGIAFLFCFFLIYMTKDTRTM